MGIVVEGLHKSFGKRKVVDGVSLNVNKGEVVGLLGPNGAGKTTSFYMIVGLERCDGGRIELDGRDITWTPMPQRARLGLGYLAQEASIFRKLSVEENILAILEVMGMSYRDRKKRLDELIQHFNLGKVIKSKGYALSGGERRRVEIARSLAASPSFLLLDEPFTGIDPIAVADIQGIIRELKQMGLGVLITDHSVRETLAIVDRAYIMFGGRILVSGTAEEIADDPDARKFYLGERFSM